MPGSVRSAEELEVRARSIAELGLSVVEMGLVVVKTGSIALVV